MFSFSSDDVSTNIYFNSHMCGNFSPPSFTFLGKMMFFTIGNVELQSHLFLLSPFHNCTPPVSSGWISSPSLWFLFFFLEYYARKVVSLSSISPVVFCGFRVSLLSLFYSHHLLSPIPPFLLSPPIQLSLYHTLLSISLPTSLYLLFLLFPSLPLGLLDSIIYIIVFYFQMKEIDWRNFIRDLHIIYLLFTCLLYTFRHIYIGIMYKSVVSFSFLSILYLDYDVEFLHYW